MLSNFDLIYLYIYKQNTSVTRAMADIYKLEGAAGFYRGLWPAIIQIMPYMGLLFSSYDIFSKGFKDLRVFCAKICKMSLKEIKHFILVFF